MTRRRTKAIRALAGRCAVVAGLGLLPSKAEACALQPTDRASDVRLDAHEVVGQAQEGLHIRRHPCAGGRQDLAQRIENRLHHLPSVTPAAARKRHCSTASARAWWAQAELPHSVGEGANSPIPASPLREEAAKRGLP
eukprot:CAMPEP_0176328386 /NCGR_PEP_ID=MMETSP0121_2-20121125/74936_1 /TAXON_ID=160619 /ORGANISM="Kryptoperidinium foliaceum, Strain CCMP 1326" /LENGTH=137 /DNA_ID=CAMNT_0017671055 /DNA_START=320 /DNA_END=730 /DNA_ORIENTATION=+